MVSVKICLFFIVAAIAVASCQPYQIVVHREIDPMEPVVVPIRRPIMIPQTTTDSQLIGVNFLGMKAGLDTNLFDWGKKK